MRSRHSNFGERWAAALAEATDRVEAEAWYRAVEGYDGPVSYRGDLTGHVIRRCSVGCSRVCILCPLTRCLDVIWA